MGAISYVESFEDGLGGWHGWVSNAAGPKPLELAHGCAVSRSPWWIDYNHAPPGAGYLHLLYTLHTTRRGLGEIHPEVAGQNRFAGGKFSTDFTGARLTVRLKGELRSREAKLCLLIQGATEDLASAWVLTSQPIDVSETLTEQTISCEPDESQWLCLGARHDRTLSYGYIPLEAILANVNVDIILVLFPLAIKAMGPLQCDLHRLRPEKDYQVWRSELPEGYVMLDQIRIDFRSDVFGPCAAQSDEVSLRKASASDLRTSD